MPYIPVDTAVQLIVGPLIDDGTFKDLETGVAYNAAGMSIDLIKSSISGTPTKTDLTLTTGGSQDWVELGNGMYYVEITAAQNNTEGELQLVGVATGILPFISAKYQVVPVAVFNSLVAGSDNLQVDSIQISGDATAADNAELFFDGTGYAAANSTIGTVTTLTGHTAQTGDSFARIGATGSGLTSLASQASVNTVDSNVDAILVDTAEIGVAGAGLTNINLPNQTMDITGNLSGSVGSVTGAVGSVTGSVGSVVGHTAQTGDTYALANGAAGFVAIDTVVDAILVDTGTTLETHLTDIKGGTFSGATDSLEQLRDRGDAAWVTGAGGSDRLLMVDTTIATLATQISFTLAAGSTDDDAYNGCTIVIEDVSTSTQKAIGIVDDYTGATKTVTLLQDPGVFTMAATDKVYILAEKGLKPTTAGNYHVDVSAGGNVGIDWANVESPTTAVDLSGTDIQLCDTVTTNTDMRGTDSAATAASLATAQADLDIITGADGVNLLSGTQTSIDNIEADTNELQADDYPTTLATLATTAELNKVPKSDGTTSWNATALAAINAEADTAISDASLATAASIAALNDISTADVATELATYDAPTKAEMDSAFTEIKGATWSSGTDTLEDIRDASGGGGSSDITSIMGTALNETSAGYLAAAFEFFFDVATPAKTVNDVGVAGSGLTQADVRTAVGLASANLDTQLSTIDTVADAIKAKTDLIGSVAATTSSASETKSLTAAVGSTESVSVVCSETVDALTLAVSVQTKSGTVVDTVADGSTTKSGTTASFALTSTMTASERILRVLITNTATSAQVASPILSVEYDT